MDLLFIGNRKTQSTIIVLIQKLANLLYIMKKNTKCMFLSEMHFVLTHDSKLNNTISYMFYIHSFFPQQF